MSISRRELLVGAAALATPGWATAGMGFAVQGRQVDEVPVPQALPDQVYSTDRVGISRATHDAHLRLFQGYANKTNEIRRALREMDFATDAPNQIYSEMRALKVNYAFAFGGYLNHEVYFDTLGGDGTPTPRVRQVIERSYGSWDRWLEDWKATGLAGRGWAYLAYDRESRRVFNMIGDSQDTYPIWNSTLLLAMDVYEHAYYLDFQASRAKYIDAYVQCIDWNAVARRIPRGR